MVNDLFLECIAVSPVWAKVQTKNREQNLVKFHARRSVFEGVHRVPRVSSEGWKKIQTADGDRDGECGGGRKRGKEAERGSSVTAADYFQPFRIHYRGSILLCLKSTTEQCIIRK